MAARSPSPVLSPVYQARFEKTDSAGLPSVAACLHAFDRASEYITELKNLNLQPHERLLISREKTELIVQVVDAQSNASRTVLIVPPQDPIMQGVLGLIPANNALRIKLGDAGAGAEHGAAATVHGARANPLCRTAAVRRRQTMDQVSFKNYQAFMEGQGLTLTKGFQQKYLAPETFYTNYPCGAKIGEGGMGKVYAIAGHEQLVLKVMDIECTDEMAFARALQEVNVQCDMKLADRPYLMSASAFTIKQIEGFYQICLVMPKMTEGDLWNLLYQVPAPTSHDIASIVHDILKGVQILNQTKQITHRDLKPENVLLYRDEAKQLRAKISDFGLIRKEETRLKRQQTCLGTRGYMPPAVEEGREITGIERDAHALAVILEDIEQTLTLPDDLNLILEPAIGILREQPSRGDAQDVVARRVTHIQRTIEETIIALEAYLPASEA